MRKIPEEEWESLQDDIKECVDIEEFKPPDSRAAMDSIRKILKL